MRILFSFAGGSGHFEPLVPIARAAQAAGHTVAFASQTAMVSTVSAAGFTVFDTGGRTISSTPRRRPLLAYSAEREDQALSEGFARRTGRERAAAILALCAAWRPDLIVCDEIDFGSMVAAERLGLPHATVLVIAAGSFVRPQVLAGPLDELRAAYGLPPDPELAMLSRYLVLSPFPPGFRDPAFPLPATAHLFRPFAPGPASNEPAPAWLAPQNGAPLVYSTLGTIFNLESGDLFQRVLAGLRDLPIRLVVTVGRDIDPADLGPQPANVRIERYIPQAALLPHCALVLSHGGSGSVTGALAHGLPMVLIPIGADQPLNARRCLELGIGQVLDAVQATPESVRAAVSGVLADAAYRQAAQRLQAEMAAMPEPAQAIRLLERLASEKQPIFSSAPHQPPA